METYYLEGRAQMSNEQDSVVLHINGHGTSNDLSKAILTHSKHIHNISGFEVFQHCS